MADFVRKLKGIMLGPGYEEDMYEDEYEDEEDTYEEPEPRSRLKDLSEWSVIRGGGKEKVAPRSNVVNFNAPAEHELVITSPKAIENAGLICDDIVQGKICVVNLEGLEKAQAQRIADFLGGVSYAINGDIERISDEIFAVAPSHISIHRAIKDDLKAGGNLFPAWLSGHFVK